jgi:hypothetical protein
MLKPEHKELDAMVRLQNDDDFKVFIEWLENSFKAEAIRSCKLRTEPQRSWEQGKVQQLEIMLQTIKDSRANLEAVESGGNEQGGE